MTTSKKITYVQNFNLPTDLVIQQKLLFLVYTTTPSNISTRTIM